ncbi:MAG: hypothetical protein ACRERS_07055, partial [Methylococcales bacterium]
MLITNLTNDLYSLGNSSVQRFYNGDGREVKRKKFDFTEDPNMTDWPNGTWQNEDPIYYIRSSVLGGEVISETWPAGKKKKTFVLAAGAKIATQSEYPWGGAGNESVSFEHFDASGLSYRSTAVNGDAIFGDGQFDGAPAELDPLGGNTGLSTPYIEPLQPPPPDQNFPYFPIDTDSPIYVNGQRVSCSLDGFAIGCGQAFSMLGNSADIDFANTSHWVLSQLGIFAVRHAVGNNDAPVPPGGNPDSAYATTRYEYEYFFSGSFWGPRGIQQQTQQGPKVDRGLPSNIRTLISDLAKRADCANILKKFADELGKKGKLDEIGKGKTFIESVFDNLKWIEINDAAAGSGARTDGDVIYVRNYGRNNTNPLFDLTKPSMSPAGQNAAYARYILQELVHNFRNGNNTFDDSGIDKAAKQILNGMDLTSAAKLRSDFAATAGK